MGGTLAALNKINDIAVGFFFFFFFSLHKTREKRKVPHVKLTDGAGHRNLRRKCIYGLNA